MAANPFAANPFAAPLASPLAEPAVEQTNPFAPGYKPPLAPGVVLPSIKRTAGQFVESAGTALEDITGPNAVARGLQDFGGGVVKANPAQIQSLSDIGKSPWTAIKEVVAEQVPQLGAAFAGARTGATLGGALGSVVPGVGTGIGATAGGVIGGLAPIFLQEYGEIRGKQKETGKENLPLALAGAGVASALERLGLEKVASKIGAKGVKEALGVIPAGASRLKHIGKEALKTAAIEGPLTEVPQTVIERYAGGQEIGTPEALSEYALAGGKGALGGGVIGGALASVAPREQPAVPPGVPPGVVPPAASPPGPLANALSTVASVYPEGQPPAPGAPPPLAPDFETALGAAGPAARDGPGVPAPGAPSWGTALGAGMTTTPREDISGAYRDQEIAALLQEQEAARERSRDFGPARRAQREQQGEVAMARGRAEGVGEPQPETAMQLALKEAQRVKYEKQAKAAEGKKAKVEGKPAEGQARIPADETAGGRPAEALGRAGGVLADASAKQVTQARGEERAKIVNALKEVAYESSTKSIPATPDAGRGPQPATRQEGRDTARDRTGIRIEDQGRQAAAGAGAQAQVAAAREAKPERRTRGQEVERRGPGAVAETPAEREPREPGGVAAEKGRGALAPQKEGKGETTLKAEEYKAKPPVKYNREPAEATDLKEREEARVATERREAEETAARLKKQEADKARGEFVLSGSDRAADEAEARGQQSLLDQPKPAETKPAKPAILRDDETHYHLPVDRGIDQDRGAAREPAGLRDLPAASRVQDKTAIYLPEGAGRGAGPEPLKRRVKQVATGWFRSGLTRVTSPEEVAHLTAPLRKEAQESLLAVVTGRDGKLLAVIRHAVGGAGSAPAEPHILLGSVHSVAGAAKVWFVHNHPSGDPKQSGADRQLTDTLGANLNGTGIESQGMIVVSPGGRASLYDARGEREITIQPGRRTQAVPVTERRFRRFTQAGAAPITSPSAMRDIMRDQDGDGILLLDHALVPVGWVKMSAEDMRTLRTGKKGSGASALYAATHETNANSLAVKVGLEYDIEAARNVAAFAAHNQMRMVDIFYGKDGRSATELGSDLSRPGPFYSRATESQGRPFGQAERLFEKADVPVTEISGTELTVGKTLWQLRQAARQRLKTYQGQRFRNADTGWEFRMSKDSVLKMSSQSQAKDDLRAAAALPSLIEHAVLAESHADARASIDIAAIHRLYAPLRIAGKLYRVKLTAKEATEGGRKLYTISAAEIEDPTVIEPATTTQSDARERPAGSALSIADLLRGAVRDSDGKPFAPDAAKYSYLGERGAKTPKHALAAAREMAGQGIPMEQIRQTTGWFRGADSGWRFEISDKGARLKLNWDAYDQTIGDALDHKVLFENYPSLAKIGLVFRFDLPENVTGGYAPADNAIHLNTNLSPGRAKSTLLHELQHAVQVIEGFARGGKPTDKGFIAAAAAMGIDTNDKSAMVSAYRRLLGEVEARDVQARRDLTAEELRERPPYESQGIKEEDFIVQFKGEEAAATTAAQTETPEFKRWFGESVVTDNGKPMREGGKPLVVYHGTRAEFGAFKPSKEGGAIFFTASPDAGSAYATRYGKSKLDPQFNELRTRLESQGVSKWEVHNHPEWEQLSQEARELGANVLPVFLSIKRPLEISGKHESDTVNRIKDDPKEIARLKRDGYDGIVVRGALDRPLSYNKEDAGLAQKRADLWIAFAPEQVKSAIGNRGTFDRESPDISYSIEAETGQSVTGLRANLSKRLGTRAIAGLERAGFEIVETEEQLPDEVRPPSGEAVRGVYWKGKSYLVASNIPEGTELSVLLHEVGVHHGLEGLLGTKLHRALLGNIKAILSPLERAIAAGKSQAELNAIRSRIARQSPLAKALVEARGRVPKKTRQAHVLEESLAYLVEDTANRNLTLVKRVLGAIRAWLLRHGFRVGDLKPEDLIALARSAVRRVSRGETAMRGLPLFSRQGDDQRRLQSVRQAMAEIAAGQAESVARGLRPDLSQYGGDADVHFPWGDLKHGIYHIGHQRGLDVLGRVLRTVALGAEVQYVPAKKTARITHDGTVAVLSLDEHGKRKTWLLTGWEEGKPDARGEVGTRTAATQPGPTFSRTELGAGFLDTIIASQAEGANEPLYSRAAATLPGLLDNGNVPPPNPFNEENRRLREQDKTPWSRAKTFWRRNFTPGGLLPAQVFDQKIIRDNELGVVEFDSSNLVTQLEHAVKQVYRKRMEELTPEQRGALQRALTGKTEGLDIRARTVIDAMRQHVDRLSAEYIQILEKQAGELSAGFDPGERTLLDAFLRIQEITPDSDSPADKGRATKEKNRILDEAKDAATAAWGDGKPMQQALGRVADVAARVGLIRTITGNIGRYVHRSYRAFDDPQWFNKIPDDVINAARSYLHKRYLEDGMDTAEAEAKAERALNTIVKTGTAYDSMESFIREGKLGAKDLSILQRRKDIAAQIRALLGEYDDPRMNYAKSTSKMARLIWNTRFLSRVREIGMGTFLFEEKDAPPGATTKIAADASEVYAPLNGLWTFPEIEQAFKDAVGKEKMADWYRLIVQMNGIVKYSKTVLSPTTSARNWMSAMFFSLANGHFDMRHVAKSITALRGRTPDYMRRLVQLGVVRDNVASGEIMQLMEDSRIEDILADKKSTPYRMWRDMNKFAQAAYRNGDDFWKVIGFENEKASLMKAGIPEAQAEKEAAERIRNTYPTYSMVGRGIKWLARFPLAGTFVSFPAEIIRTTGHMLRYVAKDYKDAKRRPLALRRAAGMAMVSGFAYALQAMTMAMMGMDDDEEEAVRLLAAPWQRNSNFLFTGRDENGQLRYFDLSFLDPYNWWKRPITAILRDQPWEDKAAGALRDMLSPFLGTDIAAGAIFEILSNKKESGGPVFNQFATPVDQTVAIANHLRKALQPGIAGNLERTYKAMQGEATASGKRYSLGDEGMAWVGFRVTTLEPKTALYYRSFEFSDAKAAATATLSRTLRSPNEVSREAIASAKVNAQRQLSEGYKDMRLIVNAARKNGLSRPEVIRVLRTSGVALRDIPLLLSDREPTLRISPQQLRNASVQARALYGPEKAREIQRRYMEAARMETAP